MMKILPRALLASVLLAYPLSFQTLAQEEDEIEMPMDQMPMKDQGMMGQGMMGRGMMGQGMMGPGMMGGCPPMGGSMGMMGHGMKMNTKALMEGRLAYIKAELNITDSQKSSWEEYVNTIKTRSNEVREMHEKMKHEMQSGSAVERIEARIKNLEVRLATMKALKTPMEALYKVLDDNQKRKADILLGKGHCMM